MPDAGPRKLRILELCAVDFTVRQFISPLALYLAEHGCEVWCGCTRGPFWDELERRGLRMVDIPISRSANVVRHAASIARLVAWLLRNRPDIVHVHTPVASLVGRIAARLAGVPTVIYTAHGFYFHDRMKRSQRLPHVLLERMASVLTTQLFCVSEEDVRSAIDYGIAEPEEVAYVGNGVDSRRFNPERPELVEARRSLRAELRLPPDGVLVTIMGRLVREKGFLEFFDAAIRLSRRHSSLHFMVVGDAVTGEHDDARSEIAALASAPELEGRLHRMGMRDDIPELLAATDIFVLPSHREGLSVALLEAMMMGKPVVATRIRGCREAMLDGQTGFLVEPQSASELSDAIDYLVRNPTLRPQLGAAARRRALARYELASVLKRQWQAIRRVGMQVSEAGLR